MDRSPLREVVETKNIIAILADKEESSERTPEDKENIEHKPDDRIMTDLLVPRPKNRVSVLKGFDPLYQSPVKQPSNVQNNTVEDNDHPVKQNTENSAQLALLQELNAENTLSNTISSDLIVGTNLNLSDAVDFKLININDSIKCTDIFYDATGYKANESLTETKPLTNVVEPVNSLLNIDKHFSNTIRTGVNCIVKDDTLTNTLKQEICAKVENIQENKADIKEELKSDVISSNILKQEELVKEQNIQESKTDIKKDLNKTFEQPKVISSDILKQEELVKENTQESKTDIKKELNKTFEQLEVISSDILKQEELVQEENIQENKTDIKENSDEPNKTFEQPEVISSGSVTPILEQAKEICKEEAVTDNSIHEGTFVCNETLTQVVSKAVEQVEESDEILKIIERAEVIANTTADNSTSICEETLEFSEPAPSTPEEITTSSEVLNLTNDQKEPAIAAEAVQQEAVNCEKAVVNVDGIRNQEQVIDKLNTSDLVIQLAQLVTEQLVITNDSSVCEETDKAFINNIPVKSTPSVNESLNICAVVAEIDNNTAYKETTLEHVSSVDATQQAEQPSQRKPVIEEPEEEIQHVSEQLTVSGSKDQTEEKILDLNKTSEKATNLENVDEKQNEIINVTDTKPKCVEPKTDIIKTVPTEFVTNNLEENSTESTKIVNEFEFTKNDDTFTNTLKQEVLVNVEKKIEENKLQYIKDIPVDSIDLPKEIELHSSETVEAKLEEPTVNNKNLDQAINITSDTLVSNVESLQSLDKLNCIPVVYLEKLKLDIVPKEEPSNIPILLENKLDSTFSNPSTPVQESDASTKRSDANDTTSSEPINTAELDTKANKALDSSGLCAASEALETVIATVAKETDPSKIFYKKAMADMNDTLALQEQELSDLKLQLNQCQQVRATLELQLRQKEEVVIKTEAEAQRKEVHYKQEIKQLKEKLDVKSEVKDEDEVKKLKDTIEKMKLKEEKLLDQLNKLSTDEDGFKQIMDEYEKTISQQLSETEKLKREHDTAKRHLATLEVAFSDVLQKYDRSKIIIEGYKNNEDTLHHSLMLANETIKKNEEKYESLKAHAKAQIEKSNKEMNMAREKTQLDLHKLTAIIKRLEIKNASLATALDQKTKECAALAALCEEVTGRVD